MSEEVNLVMESLSGVLLRTILEVTNRPQPAASSLRLQYQDVTVRLTFLLTFYIYLGWGGKYFSILNNTQMCSCFRVNLLLVYSRCYGS